MKRKWHRFLSLPKQAASHHHHMSPHTPVTTHFYPSRIPPLSQQIKRGKALSSFQIKRSQYISYYLNTVQSTAWIISNCPYLNHKTTPSDWLFLNEFLSRSLELPVGRVWSISSTLNPYAMKVWGHKWTQCIYVVSDANQELVIYFSKPQIHWRGFICF